MSKNVTLWNGRVVTVSDDQAAAVVANGEGAHETTADETGGAEYGRHEAAIHANHAMGGVDSVGDVLTGGAAQLLFGKEANDQASEGLADTLTFGAYGKAKDALSDDETVHQNQAARQAQGGARLFGNLAGVAINPAGVLGDAGVAVKGAEALGLGKMAGRAVEGAALGVGGHISDSSVTGDPLTIEGTLQAAGVGGVMGVGFGALGDKLFGGAERAQKAIAEAKGVAEDIGVAQKGQTVFSKDSPTQTIWNEVQDAQKAAVDTVSKNNSAFTKAQSAYEDALQPEKLNSTIAGFEKAQKSILKEATEANAEALAAAQEGNKAFDAADAAYQKSLTPEALGKSISQMEKAAADIEKGIKETTAASATPPASHRQWADVDPANQYSDALPPRTPYDTAQSLRDAAAKAKRAVKIGDPDVAASILGDGRRAAATDGHAVLADAVKSPEELGLARVPEPTPEVPEVVNTMRQRLDKAKLAVRMGKHEAAMDILTDLKSEAEGTTNAPLPELSTSPQAQGLSLKPEMENTLPSDLKQFARQHPSTVARMANQMNPDTAASFQKLADELGVSADDGIAGIHAKLKNYAWTIDDVGAKEAAAKAAAKAADSGQGILGWLGTQSKKAIKYTAARAADVGGPLGAFTRTIGGEATGAALNKAEDAVLGSSLMEGKAGLKASINNTLAKYGVPGSKVARALGPIAAVLSQSFPTGKKDPEPDMRVRANNRMKDFIAAQQSGPDTLYNLFTPMMGHPADLTLKFHQAVMNQLNYLVSTGPKDPGTDHTMFKSDWLPSHEQAIELAHRIEAVIDPLKAIARSVSGDGHPAGAEALNACWPATMGEFASQVTFAQPILAGLTHRTTGGYSQLLGIPASPLQDPAVIASLQGMYMQSNNQAAQGSPSGSPSAPRSPGRPAAVQSAVAGSSVAALTQ